LLPSYKKARQGAEDDLYDSLRQYVEIADKICEIRLMSRNYSSHSTKVVHIFSDRTTCI
jgi:hypothetical protein